MRVATSEEATGIIQGINDGGQDQSGSSRNGATGSHSRHTWKVESVRPADGMAVGVLEEDSSSLIRDARASGIP